MHETEPRTDRHRAYLDAQKDRITAIREELEHSFPGDQSLVLEIGCGHGHYLVAYGEQHPEARCLGIDLVSKRIRKACAKRDKRRLDHVHFLKAEIREFMAAWPERLKLERVFILFPDPWPKKRHTKNRIIQPGLLVELGRHAVDGSALHFRTDHPGNFEWCREVIEEHRSWKIHEDETWPFENPSFFQNLFTEYQSLTALFAGNR